MCQQRGIVYFAYKRTHTIVLCDPGISVFVSIAADRVSRISVPRGMSNTYLTKTIYFKFSRRRRIKVKVGNRPQ